MKFVISFLLIVFISSVGAFADSRVEILRSAVISNGLHPIEAEVPPSKLGQVGRRIFEAKSLSLNGNIACRQCHLDEFGSADGIPLAVGVSGKGKGGERVNSAYRFLSRNTLPLWGRGDRDFNVFFWDGRVDGSSGRIVSQFGAEVPSNDPLIVAVHLPPVETIEMLEFDRLVLQHRMESVDDAITIYKAITAHLRTTEPDLFDSLSRAVEKDSEQVMFLDIAKSISDF